MGQSQCDLPRCRQFGTLTYFDIALCAEHWRQIAECDPGTTREAELLAKIGLARDAHGAIGKINPAAERRTQH